MAVYTENKMSQKDIKHTRASVDLILSEQRQRYSIGFVPGCCRSKIDREWLTVEALKVCAKVLKNVFPIKQKNPFRNPTKKELAKHSALIRKQRHKSIGE
jgi:hypothetical protein